MFHGLGGKTMAGEVTCDISVFPSPLPSLSEITIEAEERTLLAAILKRRLSSVMGSIQTAMRRHNIVSQTDSNCSHVVNEMHSIT
jgi:hypothetical protein